MASITGDWNKAMPSGSSSANQGDDLMRQHWTSLQSAWNEEHYFADSTGSAGIHKLGSARVFTGTASQVSAPGAPTDEGRLMYVPATNQLHILGESATTAVTRRPFVGVHVALSSNLGIPSGAAPSSPITFGTEVFNVGSVTTSGGTIVQVPSGAGGVYDIRGAVGLSLDTTLSLTSRAVLQLRVDGTVVAVNERNDGSVQYLHVNSVQSLAGGSKVWLRFWQNSESRWTLSSSAGVPGDFSVVRLD